MRKQWFLILSSLVVLLGLGGSCVWSGVGVARKIINNSLGEHKLFKWCTRGMPVIGDLERWLDSKTYYVMLQNNTELRATGGFMGSYVRIKTQDSGFNEIKVQDIYVPDGQLPGHVEPPYPVQEAFKIGYWWLRDSNWDPDFASAAATVAWFLEQGGEGRPDGIIGVNLSIVTALLRIIGPIRVSEFDEIVTEQNLYAFAQGYAEEGFFPGSTKKRDFLGAVGGALVRRVKDARWVELGKLGKLMWDELNQKQILVWARDPGIEKEIEKRGWGGTLENNWDKESDYLYVVESNLGANKANCCVTRRVTQELGTKLTIGWENKNEFNETKPPVFWGGQYVNYNRVVIPSSHKLQAVKLQGRELRLATGEDFKVANSLRQEMSTDMYNVEERGDLQIIGFWANVPAKSKITAELNYELGSMNNAGYKILVKRQPGIEGFDYKLVYNGKLEVNDWVDRDTKYEVKK